jgi:hypothetical protein
LRILGGLSGKKTNHKVAQRRHKVTQRKKRQMEVRKT